MLGEEDRSVEAVNHLAKFVDTEQDMANQIHETGYPVLDTGRKGFYAAGNQICKRAFHNGEAVARVPCGFPNGSRRQTGWMIRWTTLGNPQGTRATASPL